jgi:hypothetical protein
MAPALSLPDKDAAAMLAFQNRVAQYMALHDRVEETITLVALPTDALNVYAISTALRDKLRPASAWTQEGTIFAPYAAAILKRLISQTIHGDYAGLLRATHEENSDQLGRALVNEQWPGTALTSMPPDVPAVLPRLRPELQYRFVHRDLVLWDVRAI